MVPAFKRGANPAPCLGARILSLLQAAREHVRLLGRFAIIRAKS